jgi:hypothetical protein
VSLWGKFVDAARNLLGGGRSSRRARRADRNRRAQDGYACANVQTSDLLAPSSAFESGVIREMRRLTTEETAPFNLPPEVAEADPSTADTYVKPAPQKFEDFNKFPTSGEDVLPLDVLRYFDAVGIMPIVGVNDPAMRQKLANPTQYGWGPRVRRTETSSGVSSATLSSLQMWHLEAPRECGARVGQNVILAANGDVFVETAGPWGTNWMHRSASSGVVTSREHRVGQIRIPGQKPRGQGGASRLARMSA